MACVADREAAVREVAQVYELIKLHQPLLLLHSQQAPSSSTIQLAQSLLGHAQRALNVALSVMKQQQQQQPAAPPVTPINVIKAEPHQLSPPTPASADSDAMAPRRGGAKRRRSSVPPQGKRTASSWATLTAVPYDDGYEWRKYGEKKINGTLFTRSYFRCTYKDDAGCLATKHVQQMDGSSSDPPMYHVTYNNDHTCCNASACFPCDQMMPQCQEPLFPTSMEQQFLCSALRDHDSPVDGGEIPSATGSCISGETCWWDGYSADMEAQMMAAEANDPLHDLERFLMRDSFMDC